MIEIIKAAFFAGEVKTFLIQGEYVEILDAAYPVDVAMMDRSGAQLSTMRNAEASYFSRPGKYEVIQVTSALAQTVRLFVGSGDAGTRRTSGDVSVIDGEKSRTLAGGNFIGSPAQGAVAGQFSMVQLWNPLGSGKNLILQQTGASSPTAGQLNLTSVAVAFATDITSTNGANKKIGAAMGVGQLRGQNTAGGLSNTIKLFNISSSTEQVWKPAGGFVIGQGYGIGLQHQTVNSNVVALFEWFEETI